MVQVIYLLTGSLCYIDQFIIHTCFKVFKLYNRFVFEGKLFFAYSLAYVLVQQH